MNSQLKNISHSYLELQEYQEMMAIELIDDLIDNWKVTFKYDKNKCVILNFKFHLIELLPPKVLLIFPTYIEIICWKELGSATWDKSGNITTLLLSLWNEYKYQATVYTENSEVFTAEKAQTKWEYVTSRHNDWKLEDVTELMNQIPIENINELRTQAKIDLKLNKDENKSIEDINENDQKIIRDINEQDTNENDQKIIKDINEQDKIMIEDINENISEKDCIDNKILEIQEPIDCEKKNIIDYEIKKEDLNNVTEINSAENHNNDLVSDVIMSA